MDNDLFNNLIAKELTVMEIHLEAKAGRTAITIDEYYRSRVAQGVSPNTIEKELIDDLENGGKMFNEFRNVVKATAHGNMMRISDAAIAGENGVEVQYRWVAVFVNTCPDCMELHGEVKSWDEWESEGLPRSGNTVCGDNCQCMLLPEDTTELAPINRGE